MQDSSASLLLGHGVISGASALRLEFAGALYQITSRGDSREMINRADDDRDAWLEILGNVYDRCNWVVHAYCQMTNI